MKHHLITALLLILIGCTATKDVTTVVVRYTDNSLDTINIQYHLDSLCFDFTDEALFLNGYRVANDVRSYKIKKWKQ